MLSAPIIAVSLPSDGPYGWGVCGKNLLHSLCQRARVLVHSQTMRPQGYDCPMLHTVSGAGFIPASLSAWSNVRNVGLAFIEDYDEAVFNLALAKRYFDHIICGSTWCANMLGGLGLSTSVAIQGVDESLFYSVPGKRPTGKRFVIGSFGKYEFRKGQDIIIKAFSELANEINSPAQYGPVHLVACWGNPFPSTVNTMLRSNLLNPNINFDSFHSDFKTFLETVFNANNLPREYYTIIDTVPNHEMPFVYRACDVAVFASRCEAGTNLPLMEAMACGVPVIAAATTGHSDVLTIDANTLTARIVTKPEGWCEIDYKHLKEHMRAAYNGTHPGYRSSQSFTWDAMADRVIADLLNYDLKHS